ncbi:hypothetical protein OO013_19570 [Mangrovivirga sp. M17]|uniref:DUF3857 domain-containing protein n=1 Tax=Mangrovivirga halotolerans TaxID=2993936 RepID=A0ABT3RWC9_9BACT|nr:hypothetical protein [Mangrovivirga halotolerans]MCX2746087.1 hypothetical protein [Mangrovivirga halotolerans]
MMRAVLILLLALSISIFSYSQTKYRVGKVSEDDWQIEKLDSLKQVCDAVIIENIGSSRIDYSLAQGWMLEYNYYVKVLVLNEDGIQKYGNLDVKHYEKDDVYIKGYSYNLNESGKVEKEKFKTGDAIKSEYTSSMENFILHVPSLKKNSIVEYELKIISENIANVRDWEFQAEDPVFFSEYTTILPEYFDFNAFYQGSYSVQTENESGTSTITDEDFTENYIYKKSVYSAKNLPGVPDEIFSSVKENSFTKYRFEIRGYKDFRGIYHPLAQSYSDIMKNRLFKSDNFSQYKRNNGVLDQILGEANIENNIAGARMVFRSVSKNIAWSQKYGGVFPDNGYRKIINDKRGDASELNNLLIGAYRRAGFTAYPVLLNTRESGFVNPFVPLLSNFNYVICLLEIEGHRILIDATEPHAPFGMIPLRCINGNGLVVRDDATEQWINLSKYLDAETLTTAQYSIDPVEENINKQITRKRKGVDLITFTTGLDSAEYVEEFKEDYLSEFSGANIKEHRVSVENNACIESLDVSKPALIANNTIYINLFEDFQLKNNPFKNENRYQTIDFLSPWRKVFMINLEVPEGYTLQSELENKLFMTSDKKMEFRLTKSKIGKKATYVVKLSIDENIFLRTKYPEIKMFFDAIEQELSKQIILVKEV